MKVDDEMAARARAYRTQNPIGTQWAFCTEDGELEFEVIGMRDPHLVSCRFKSTDPDGQPLRFLIGGEDWLDFIVDGRIIFKGETT